MQKFMGYIGTNIQGLQCL